MADLRLIQARCIAPAVLLLPWLLDAGPGALVDGPGRLLVHAPLPAADVLLLSDYAKGTLTLALTSTLLKAARAKGNMSPR